MAKSLAISTEELIRIRTAELRIAQLELELARLRAGLDVPIAQKPAPKAPAPKAPAPKAPAPKAPAPKAAVPKVANPNLPATPRQLFMLHILMPGRPDTRGLQLTRAQASARIQELLDARKSVQEVARANAARATK
jgi:hypothetical protein